MHELLETYNIRVKLGDYLILFIGVILIFWPISFFIYTLPWDVMDCYLPWRHHVSSCIHNGELPLWNPYQHLGYPIHADMRSVWSPGIWLVSILGGYNPYTFNIIFIAMVFISSAGMLSFLGNFIGNRQIKLLLALVYVSTGYFVSHAQEPSAIAAAAIIPFLLHAYLQLFKERSFGNILQLALLMFLMIASAYQAITIVTFYLLLILFVYFLLASLRKGSFKDAFSWIGANLAMAVILGLCCVVLIVSFVQVQPYFGRFGGLEAGSTTFFPFTLRGLLSFFTPYAVSGNAEFFRTDLTMANAYMGLLTVLLAIAGFIQTRLRFSPLLWILSVFGALSFLASFGNETIIFRVLFNYVPFFNLFRFPAFLNYFTLIPVFIFTGLCLQRLLENDLNDKWLNPLKIGAYSFMAIILFLVVLSLIKFDSIHFLLKGTDFKKVLHESLYARIIVQGLLQFLLLFLFLKAIKLSSKRKVFIPVLVMAEVLMSLQLCMPHTGYGDYSPSYIKAQLECRFSSIHEVSQTPVVFNSDQSVAITGLWRNTNIFRKTVSVEGYNSFQLNDFANLSKEHPEFLNSLIKHPVMFRTNDTLLGQHINKYTNKDATLSEIEDVEYLSIAKVSSHEFKAVSSYAMPSVVHLLQNYYPGWIAFIDESPAVINQSNGSFMSVRVPSGKHEISFKYINSHIEKAFYVSAISFLIALFLFFFLYVKRLGLNVFVHPPFVAGSLLFVFFSFACLFSSRSSIDLSASPLNQDSLVGSLTQPEKDSLSFFSWYEAQEFAGAEILSPSQQFSKLGVTIPPEEYNFLEKVIVRVNGKIKETTNDNLFLVMHSIDTRSGNTSNYHAVSLVSLQRGKNEVKEFECSIPMKLKKSPSECIKIYFWNTGRTNEILLGIRYSLYAW